MNETSANRWISLDFQEQDLHPRLREMHAYWRGKQIDGKLPRRQDIDPLELPPKTLPWIFILERVGESGRARWRFRLVGTKLVEHRGHDVKGRFVDEVTDGEQRAHLIELFDTLVREGKPILEFSRYPRFSKELVPLTALVLPLASDGRNPDAALIAAVLQEND